MTATVGFAIPSIPPRAKCLQTRAIPSVLRQTHPVAEIAVAFDMYRMGAGDTRNKAKAMLNTEWTCFLDDDDELLPHHVEALLARAMETGADAVYPWFKVVGGWDPFPQWAHTEWDPEDPHIFPITALIRTELAQQFDFPDPLPNSAQAGEDWPFWTAVNEVAKIVHLDDVTWRWHWDPQYPNTSGVPSRW